MRREVMRKNRHWTITNGYLVTIDGDTLKEGNYEKKQGRQFERSNAGNTGR
jgi:hypothetical protein